MASSTTPVPNNEPVSRSSSDSSVGWLKIAVPYALAIIVQLPMLLLYFRVLWKRPHYQTFVFAIIAVVAIAWSRWPRESPSPFHRSLRSNVLLVLAVLMGLCGVVFLESWFHAASVFLLVASLLARTTDADTGKGMATVALPLFVFLQLPFGFDYRLITWLQRVSAVFTSRLLDLINYGHHMPGTVIQVPGKEGYGIEAACSGVQSFFTLLFVAVVFIVWNRRPLFRSIMLVGAAVFWAIFMNTVRIFLIPVADRTFGVDLAHGFPHDVLGWTVMTIGILLLFSTDQFLLFLFGPVEPETGKSGPFGTLITNVWNGLIAGDMKDDESKRKKKARRSITPMGRNLIWGAAAILTLCSLYQVKDIWQSFNAPRALRVKFFDGSVEVPYNEEDVPKEVDNWTMAKYEVSTRTRGSDLGLRSDTWRFESKNCTAFVSLDQTFPGWHELTTCYRSQGWTMVKRVRKKAYAPAGEDGKNMEWSYVEAHFEKKTGERGFLVFSLFDAFGKPFDAPAEWDTLNAFFDRAKNRLNHKIRARLFRGEGYQTQAFVQTFGEIDESVQQEITDRYLTIREIIRKAYVDKKSTGGGAGEPPVEPEVAQP